MTPDGWFHTIRDGTIEMHRREALAAWRATWCIAGNAVMQRELERLVVEQWDDLLEVEIAEG